MKEQFLKWLCGLAICSFFIYACEKKKNDAISPTYISEAPGSSGNPNPNYIPPTNTNTATPATQNSNLYVGAVGWSNLSCVTTNSLYLKSQNGNTEVTLQFSAPPAPGTFTYNIATTPGLMSCALIVTGDPNQPEGTVWHGYSGAVAVSSTTSGINASLIGSIPCRQTSFQFPIVSVSGVLGCN